VGATPEPVFGSFGSSSGLLLMPCSPLSPDRFFCRVALASLERFLRADCRHRESDADEAPMTMADG
jgi:hypothetical protein